MALKPKSKEEIEGIVQGAISNAVDFVETEITRKRVKLQRYYDGEVDIGHEEGRSKVVSTKVRDTIRAVKPSLMRIFLSSTKPVEFVPHGPEDVASAEQATEFMHYQFQKNNGMKVLSDVFHDALVMKQGIVKAYWMEYQTAKIYTYSELSDDEYAMLVSDDDVEIIEHSVESSMSVDDYGMEIDMPEHSVKISRSESDGKLCIESVPPEEFFVDRDARSLDDAYIVAHRTEMRVGDLVAMGFDFDVVEELDGFYTDNEMTGAEIFERQGYTEDLSGQNELDPSMKKVAVTEAYMRMDVDGTGIPVLHKFLCGGTKYELLDYEPIDEIPFSKFEIDPIPHSFYGRSLAELILDDQDASTSIMRGILDNVAMTNNPRLGIIEGAVSLDDVLNNEIGGVIRMRQAGAVMPLEVPFSAGQTLGAMQYLDAMIEQKTGVSRASMGLNNDAMQSTTKAAVQATVQAAAGQVEVMVRNLAIGMRDLFGIMLRLYQKNVDEEQIMRLNNQFIPVDPRVWNSEGMDVSINVGLGTGREEEKMSALQMALQLQMQVFQQYGPMNGVVSMTNIRNTVADMLAINGVRNTERYFAPMDAQREQQIMQQNAQQQQGQQPSDPNQAFLQAEQMKVQGRVQTDMMKAQTDRQKAIMQDDRERDKMYQELALKNAELQAKYGLQANEQAIRAEQERQRMMMSPMGNQ